MRSLSYVYNLFYLFPLYDRMWQCCMIIFFFDFGTAISIDLEESKLAYTNQWAVSSGGTYDVRHVISSHGFIYSYKVRNIYIYIYSS